LSEQETISSVALMVSTVMLFPSQESGASCCFEVKSQVEIQNVIEGY